MRLITHDPLELARRRVRRGIAWLHAHAPAGWERNAFSVDCFRARDCYDSECILALAFEQRKDLANANGYVTYASVIGRVGLTMRQSQTLGFLGYGDIQNSALLDCAWEEALRTYARPHIGARRHDRAA